jgi:hypothetical protein
MKIYVQTADLVIIPLTDNLPAFSLGFFRPHHSVSLRTAKKQMRDLVWSEEGNQGSKA